MTREITPAQCLQARMLLGWSRDRLAPLAETSIASIQKFERQKKPGSAFFVETVRAVFEGAGVIFADGVNQEPAVRLSGRSGGESIVIDVMSLSQYHQARALLGWTRSRVAAKAGISADTAAKFEKGLRRILPRTLAAMRETFECAGVEFTAKDSGETLVRLRER